MFQFPTLNNILNNNSTQFTVSNPLLANVCGTNNTGICDLSATINIVTNLDVILANIKTPQGFSGPYITGWGYSSKVGCFKSVYIGNICDLYANFVAGRTISSLSGLPSNGYDYGFTINQMNINAKLNIAFLLSYYNSGATYGETTLPSGSTVFENDVRRGVHYIYVSRLCPYLKNEMNAILTPYQTLTYNYFGCSGAYVNSLPGFTGLYPVTGLHTQYAYSSADPAHVPFDILLDYLQDI